ncbi:MAG TPA: glycosyltransferase family 4 protein, partial [Gammaproteobacteria bacterium]|nr:glycosyltransferase family 4 protein [Gammaproteobacteria bacterium]
SPPLKVLYAGRGGRQKRVWLLNRIVEYFVPTGLPIEFHFAGTMADELSPTARDAAIVHGEIGNRTEMQALYAASHVVILVSGFEGFPMVVKEGMASSCVPVVTALPGYQMHLTDHENALLIEAVDDEVEVVRLAIARLEELMADRALVAKLSTNAKQYARRNFGMEAFRAKYRELLLAPLARSDRM